MLDPARALSTGLTTASYAWLLRQAGFLAIVPRALTAGEAGPPAQLLWRWRPPRKAPERDISLPAARDGAFAALAELVL